MLRPTEPRCYCLTVGLERGHRLLTVQTGDGATEILLYTLVHKPLMTVELIAHIIEGAS